jgi:hypothetical protein
MIVVIIMIDPAILFMVTGGIKVAIRVSMGEKRYS